MVSSLYNVQIYKFSQYHQTKCAKNSRNLAKNDKRPGKVQKTVDIHPPKTGISTFFCRCFIGTKLIQVMNLLLIWISYWHNFVTLVFCHKGKHYISFLDAGNSTFTCMRRLAQFHWFAIKINSHLFNSIFKQVIYYVYEVWFGNHLLESFEKS